LARPPSVHPDVPRADDHGVPAGPSRHAAGDDVAAVRAAGQRLVRRQVPPRHSGRSPHPHYGRVGEGAGGGVVLFAQKYF